MRRTAPFTSNRQKGEDKERRMKTKINENWEFCELAPESSLEEALEKLNAGEGEQVTLPHDWLIKDARNLYRDGRGWYRRKLFWNGSKPRAYLIFDGVYMDSAYYLNGEKIGEWKYGYTRHSIDLTGKLQQGWNELVVSATFLAPNSRWYSGAGIERDVWLVTEGETRIDDGGIYLSSKKQADGKWLLRAETEISGPDRDRAQVEIAIQRGKEPVPALAREAEPELSAQPGQTIRAQVLEIENVREWSPEHPNLYTVTVSLVLDGSVLQTESFCHGFRTIRLDPDAGCILNGEHIKLNGVCLHSDAGALGNTFHRQAVIRQLQTMREMGANALRLAHNPFAEETLEIADRMGFLVIDEAFDMWEKSKTPFDYARFFDEWQERDIRSYVRRDRNHPCVFLWSIGNEIYDQHAGGRGYEITEMLTKEVRALDPCGNAKVTAASNYLPWENAQHCADVYKVVGYNYSEQYYKDHHRAHPDWVIYGSETVSVCQSRGVYHFPLSAGILSEEDEQCSALGNAVTSWGTRHLEDAICGDRDLPWTLGQFVWAGADYLGEPTPYKTKNSYLGLVDTAGFPKDDYYVFQSAWTDGAQKPMIHVFPWWDFNPGQLIDVRVCSNQPVVELFLNGKSLGRQRLDHAPGSGTHLIADWQIPYEEGELTAVGYRETPALAETCRESRHSFGDTDHFSVEEDPRTTLDPEHRTEDLHYYRIQALDRDGNPVENASDYVRVEVLGGKLLALDNGDSTDWSNYQNPCRHLFSGKLLAIARGPEDMQVTVTAQSPVAVRKILLLPDGETTLGPEKKTAGIRAVVMPECAEDQEVTFSAVDANGVATNIARIEQIGQTAKITAIGDGMFYVRCTSKSGDDHTRVISQMEYRVEGLGQAYLDPYGFISGSQYSDVQGTVGNGNEKGIATARDGETTVTWSSINFGTAGSDRIRIWIFALTSEEYPIQIWEGIPGEEGAELLADAIYCKPTIWNTYQPETFALSKRLRGISRISIRVHQKIHIKGFTFEKSSRAWQRLSPAEADEIYGDSYEQDGEKMRHIGNNVTFLFRDMDFTGHALSGIRISGGSSLPQNTIHIRFYDGKSEEKDAVEFMSAGGRIQEFSLPKREGTCEVSVIFLPGSDFDLDWIEFF